MTANAGRNCTPGYRPCIPTARPTWTATAEVGMAPGTPDWVVYRVRGADRYRLDGDNDGRGCE